MRRQVDLPRVLRLGLLAAKAYSSTFPGENLRAISIVWFMIHNDLVHTDVRTEYILHAAARARGIERDASSCSWSRYRTTADGKV